MKPASASDHGQGNPQADAFGDERSVQPPWEEVREPSRPKMLGHDRHVVKLDRAARHSIKSLSVQRGQELALVLQPLMRCNTPSMSPRPTIWIMARNASRNAVGQ